MRQTAGLHLACAELLLGTLPQGSSVELPLVEPLAGSRIAQQSCDRRSRNQNHGVEMKVLNVAFAVIGLTVLVCGAVDAANLLANSSFEVCTVERLPDFWGNGRMGVASPRWVLDTDSWRAHWGVVTTTSHSGKRSIRIDCPGDSSDLALQARWIDAPNLNATYTLSFWAKSDRADMPVRFGFEPPLKDVKVGTQWARYSVTASAYDKTLTIVIYPQAKGVMWVDDVQFELGGEPADYAPSPMTHH